MLVEKGGQTHPSIWWQMQPAGCGQCKVQILQLKHDIDQIYASITTKKNSYKIH